MMKDLNGSFAKFLLEDKKVEQTTEEISIYNTSNEINRMINRGWFLVALVRLNDQKTIAVYERVSS